MKRLLVLGVLALAGFTLSVADAAAGFFWNHHINRYSTFIACRPYNAFTPVCYGSIVCDGCCPAPFCGGAPPMWRPQTMPAAMAPPPSCCDAGCLPPDHALASLPPGYAGAPMPSFQPMPMYAQAMPYPHPQPMPYPMPYPPSMLQGQPTHGQPHGMPYPPPGFYGQPPPMHMPPQAGSMPPGAQGMPPPGYIPQAPLPVPTQTSQQWPSQAGYGVQPVGYYPSYYHLQNYLTNPASTAPSYWYGR